MELFIPNKLKDKVTEWRESSYKCDHPTIEEILEYSFINNETGLKSLRYLRKAQIEALETYWYLRLVENKDYDGKVFNIFYSDVPEKKNDLIKGHYEIEILKKKVTIAIKIIDMLGEELLITKNI